MKHTRGPWHVRRYRESKYTDVQLLIEDNDGSYIGEIKQCGELEAVETETANAQLIAAAPEMLEALCSIRCLPNFEAMLTERFSKPTANALISQLDETIQKARGGANDADTI